MLQDKITVEEAIRFARLCGVAGTNDFRKLDFLGIRFNLTAFDFEEESVEGFHFEDEKSFYVVFRASENEWKDWRDSLNFFDFGFFGTHPGVAKKLSLKIRSYLLNEVKKSNKPVVLLGHSLGGALARESYLHLKKHAIPVEKVVTFGAYASFRRFFYERTKEELVNYFVGNDVIRLFSKLMNLFGFKNDFVILKYKGFWSWKAHQIKNYISLLEDKQN